MVPPVVFGTKEAPAMAPNIHPHVVILIVTAERIIGAVEDCLQRHLCKIFGTKEALTMAPNSHPQFVILIVMAERIVGAVEDCLQRHLCKTKLIMQLNIKHSRCKRMIIYSPYEQEGSR